ncbi:MULTISPECIES: DUF3124 domain-containing protein [Galbibacter]|uniref:DUF3124 domain-containing protein n=1 Tax=Galbibacter pacificus TaxID=2996052 RepID=A0ABT6FPT7_9FLAO|nr:DUF3124 domain-containing protein [Galbibacter pacificus]MDG3582252.1 DUF3124 domain-containing protein [Galbibacter pacificus]MDG3585272.1 DUF3124 domain-containing protein [Galbibacter pacificus]
MLIIVFSFSCKQPVEDIHDQDIEMVNWESRNISLPANDSLWVNGQTYLSIYSQIYSYTQHGKHDLTTTVSLRNISSKDSIYITKADYHNEKGALIRSYVKKPVYIAPLETIEIVIAKDDNHGGSGGNFIFDWTVSKNTKAPYFEAVMISTAGQQGLSFTTQGIRVK